MRKLRRQTEITPKEREVLEGWERGETLLESATRLKKAVTTIKQQRNSINWKRRQAAMDREFTQCEIAFLCWVRMHAISPGNEDVELGNRLIAQAGLIARTRALSKAE